MSKLNFNQMRSLVTYVVGIGGHYKTIQEAIDALPAGGGEIFVKEGTFTITTPILIKQSNTTIRGNGKTTIITGDGASVATFIKPNVTNLNSIVLKDFQLIGSNVGRVGLAIDFSTVNVSLCDNLYIFNFDTAVKLDDKNGTATNTNTTFYNTFRRIGAFSVNFGFKFKDLANHNHIKDSRIAVNGATAGTAIVIDNCQAIEVYNTSCEPANTTSSVGIDIIGASIGVLLHGNWIEGNAIGVQASSTCESVHIMGGTISANTNNLQDPTNKVNMFGAVIEYSNTNKFSGVTSKITNGNSRNGYDLTLDTSANTVKGYSVKNAANFAHTGAFFYGETLNGSDTANIYEAVNRGTGNSINISNGTTPTFTVGADGAMTIYQNLNANNKKVTNLLDPTNSQDGATKQYVDSLVSGLKGKASVKASSTASLTLSGLQTVDGIALIAGDRILVKDQTTASQNGIYAISATAWTRTSDADSWIELVSALVIVEEGTVNADKLFLSTVNQGGVLNTTAVVWVAFGSFSGLTNSNFVTRETPAGTLNGINLVFTLVTAPVTGSERVYLNGQLQDLTADYTIATNTITFVIPPISTDSIKVNYSK